MKKSIDVEIAFTIPTSTNKRWILYDFKLVTLLPFGTIVYQHN